jgi:hypothetical protein
MTPSDKLSSRLPTFEAMFTVPLALVLDHCKHRKETSLILEVSPLERIERVGRRGA